jgi:hypothetical protein
LVLEVLHDIVRLLGSDLLSRFLDLWPILRLLESSGHWEHEALDVLVLVVHLGFLAGWLVFILVNFSTIISVAKSVVVYDKIVVSSLFDQILVLSLVNVLEDRLGLLDLVLL